MWFFQYLLFYYFFLFLSNHIFFSLNKSFIYLTLCFNIFLSPRYYWIVYSFIVFWCWCLLIFICNGEYFISPQNRKHFFLLLFKLLFDGWPYFTYFLFVVLLTVIFMKKYIRRFSLFPYLHHKIFNEWWSFVIVIKLALRCTFLPFFLWKMSCKYWRTLVYTWLRGNRFSLYPIIFIFWKYLFYLYLECYLPLFMGYFIDNFVFVSICPIYRLFFYQWLSFVLQKIHLFLFLIFCNQIFEIVSNFQGLLVYPALYFSSFLTTYKYDLILCDDCI